MESGVPEPKTSSPPKVKLPPIVEFNTTVVGLKYKDGVIIAVDARPAGGKKMASIHRLHDNIYAGATGVGKDMSVVVDLIQSKLRMHHMSTDFRLVPVCCANLMLKQLLHSQACELDVTMLIGGVDDDGLALYTTRFDGSSSSSPFSAIGGGVWNAMSILNMRWRSNLDKKTASDIAYEAMVIGMGEDRGPVQLCFLGKDYSVEQETVGLVVEAPKLDVSRIVTEILHESVVRVDQGGKQTERAGGDEKETEEKEKNETEEN